MPFLGKRADSANTLNLSGLLSNVTEPATWGEDHYRPSGRVPELGRIPGRKTCGNSQCTATWTAPWRSRKRPLFEEQWGCSGRCVLALVLAAIRRESTNAFAREPEQHQHRIPLGLLLLGQGWITHPQLRHALEVQRERGGRIGEILTAECGVDRNKIMRGLSLQWSCPVLGADGFSPGAMALVAPRIFIERLGILPLRIAGSRILYVGSEDGFKASAALALEQMSGLTVENGLMKTEEYQAARDSLLEREGVKLTEEDFSETDALAARITAILEQKQPLASKLVRVRHYYWLRLWLEAGAKGLHGSVPRNGEDMLDYVFTVRTMGREI